MSESHQNLININGQGKLLPWNKSVNQFEHALESNLWFVCYILNLVEKIKKLSWQFSQGQHTQKLKFELWYYWILIIAKPSKTEISAKILKRKKI